MKHGISGEIIFFSRRYNPWWVLAFGEIILGVILTFWSQNFTFKF